MCSDGLYLESLLDKHLGFKTHRIHTPHFDINKREEKMLELKTCLSSQQLNIKKATSESLTVIKAI